MVYGSDDFGLDFYSSDDLSLDFTKKESKDKSCKSNND
jgi:hypothetical protein